MDTPSISSPLDAAPNYRVRSLLRVILTLTAIGLFVSGALSIVKIFPDLGLPCGGAHGCDIVNNHPSSKWFGVPVAYIGFLGYVLIAALAVARSGATAAKARPLALGGYLISAFGAMTSVALQIYSLTQIHATCLWCLASASVMILLLVFHALEYSDRVAGEAADGKGEFPLVTVLGVALLIGLVGFKATLQKSNWVVQKVSETTLSQMTLVPKDAHIYGDKDSPVTIVEFADLMCPMCQQSSPKVKEFVAKHNGRVRLVYRNFPLTQIHKMGSLAAAVGEAAAEKGKFWEYMTAIMATGENMETPDRVFEVAATVGLDRPWIEKQLASDEGPAMTRLTNDINAAGALGITMTPTFLVQVKGMDTEAYDYKSMMQALQNGKYKSLIEGK